MLKNYLKIGLRKLNRNKSHSLLNIVGLAIGMAGFILIFLFVQEELSYDTFHEKGERIYRIAGEYDQGGDTRNRSAMTTYLMKRWLDTSFPDIKNTVRLGFGSGLIKYGDKAFHEEYLVFADPGFFDMFTFELVRGEPATVIAEPNTMVITESIAEKYFGDQDPLEEVLEMDGVPVKITGVMKDIPENSHFHGDFVISMKTVEPLYPKWVLTNATGISHYTYVELREGVRPEEIETQLTEYIESKDREFAETRSYFLQPLRDIHLHSNLTSEIEANSDMLYVYVLSAVALVILLMACINYTNLAVARSAAHSTEVGIRKVVGANRKQLVLQFLGESVVVAVFALLLALLLVEMSLPLCRDLTGKSLQLNLADNVSFMVGLFLLALLLGGFAGSYPALILSRLPSVHVLKTKFAGSGDKSINLRKVLVGVQFVAATALLVSTLIICNQLTFMQNKKLGINPELVLTVPFQTNDVAAQFEQLRTELLRHPDVLQVAATNNRLTARVSHWREYEVQGLDEEIMIPTMIVSHDFFETLQAEFKAGRDFSRDFQTDVTAAYILNESAVKFLGLKSPVGTSVTGAAFNGEKWSQKRAQIIGVVKDFHLASLHKKIQPTVFSIASERTTPLRVMTVRISNSDVSNTLNFVEETWRKLIPGRPVQFTFMDADVQKLYEAEERFLQIFLGFAILAIAITCLGLFGLSAYAAVQRTREIGIRKVMGATVSGIVLLLSKEFVMLSLLANLVAWPIAYYAMDRWLQDFAYRIDIGWWVFALAGGFALVIALLTVSTQAVRAAIANPVESLRYE